MYNLVVASHKLIARPINNTGASMFKEAADNLFKSNHVAYLDYSSSLPDEM